MSRIKVLFSCVAFCAVLLSACSDFHAPVEEYLDEYANRAAIGSQIISVPTQRDINSIECVSSETNVTITFFLRNPRSYKIQPTLTFNNTGLDPVQGLMSQSPDRQSITLTFLQSYLASNDRGTDFSGTISLSEAATGSPFPSWDYSLHCNTPPPCPTEVSVMLDVASGANYNTYVLCFNLDLTNPVHDDLASITINGEYFEIANVIAGPGRTITFSDSRLSTERPSQFLPVGSLPSFSADPNNPNVYFHTGIPKAAGMRYFTVTLCDTMGLSSTASTLSPANKLAPVTVIGTQNRIYPDSDELLSFYPDTNGDYQITLSHENSGSTIHYTLDSVTYSVPSPTTISVTAAATDNYLKVWATKTGYVDSNHRYIRLDCRPN